MDGTYDVKNNDFDNRDKNYLITQHEREDDLTFRPPTALASSSSPNGNTSNRHEAPCRLPLCLIAVCLRRQIQMVQRRLASRLQILERHPLSFKRETGIDKYHLYAAGGIIYTYQLDIHVMGGESDWLRTYVFEDSTFDEYNITAFRDSEHSVSFNSKDPYILRVKETET